MNTSIRVFTQEVQHFHVSHSSATIKGSKKPIFIFVYGKLMEITTKIDT